MNYLYGFSSISSSFVGNVYSFFTSMNSASLSGAVDVIVVEQSDGNYLSTPFHVRFGKYSVFNYDQKYVDIKINGQEIALKMKLGESGVAFFVQETNQGEKVPRWQAASPMTSNTQLKSKNLKKSNQAVSARHSRSDLFDKTTRIPKRRRTTSDRMVKKQKRYHLGKISRINDLVLGSFSESDVTSLRFDSKTQLEKVPAEFKYSIELSSNQLQSLGLRYGSNEAQFSITTKIQGTASCSCHIYLFKRSELLVISDIDGTITKSDVLGHVMPVIGGTWAHAGVAELYTRISANGYKMVYLSSRSIGMSETTKTYLQTVKQEEMTLPAGPVLLAPTSILMALKKEVIERRPQEFKIACLSELGKLFPGKKPFVAGFGNRPTDVESYKEVGIPDECIFIINTSGIVSRSDRIGYASDYVTMAKNIVDYMFPPLSSRSNGCMVEFAKAENGAFSWWATSSNLLNMLVDKELEAYNRKVDELRKKKKNAKK